MKTVLIQPVELAMILQPHLDGDETTVYVLNDYYTAAVDDYKRGSLSYPFRDLSPGLHTLKLKAWDVYNNASTQEIQFIVFDEDVQP